MNVPRNEIDRLQLLKNLLENIEMPDINGFLCVYNRRNKTEFYHSFWDKTKQKEIRTYLNKENMHIVKDLAMKSYLEDLRNVLNAVEEAFDSKASTDILKSIDNIYESYSPIKKTLVDPIMPTYQMMLDKWKSSCIKSTYPFSSSGIYTKKGERVRSKSEKILADIFYDKGIEYVYEARLDLSDGSMIYPDFTFLHPRTREFIYWEHNGKMNDPNYINRAIMKIIRYDRDGIKISDRLVITYETDNISLDQGLVESLINQYLL